MSSENVSSSPRFHLYKNASRGAKAQSGLPRIRLVVDGAISHAFRPIWGGLGSIQKRKIFYINSL